MNSWKVRFSSSDFALYGNFWNEWLILFDHNLMSTLFPDRIYVARSNPG